MRVRSTGWRKRSPRLTRAPVRATRTSALAVAAEVSRVQSRGWVEAHDLQAFLTAGYEQKHVLDVLTIVSLKTLSNYVNHMAESPLDPQLAGFKWEPNGVL